MLKRVGMNHQINVARLDRQILHVELWIFNQAVRRQQPEKRGQVAGRVNLDNGRVDAGIAELVESAREGTLLQYCGRESHCAQVIPAMNAMEALLPVDVSDLAFRELPGIDKFRPQHGAGLQFLLATNVTEIEHD